MATPGFISKQFDATWVTNSGKTGAFGSSDYSYKENTLSQTGERGLFDWILTGHLTYTTNNNVCRTVVFSDFSNQERRDYLSNLDATHVSYLDADALTKDLAADSGVDTNRLGDASWDGTYVATSYKVAGGTYISLNAGRYLDAHDGTDRVNYLSRSGTSGLTQAQLQTSGLAGCLDSQHVGYLKSKQLFGQYNTDTTGGLKLIQSMSTSNILGMSGDTAGEAFGRSGGKTPLDTAHRNALQTASRNGIFHA